MAQESSGSAIVKEAHDFSKREFPMSDADFSEIRTLAKDATGIELGDHKKEMIYSRIVRCIRQRGLENFKDYLELLKASPELEMTPFINSITTNLTAFFRESHHFDFLQHEGIPEIMQRNAANKRIRVWSAGCSTGEEPYSIGITLNNCMGNKQWDARILATDLDTNVINHGRAGLYSKDRVGNLSADIVRKSFVEENGSSGGPAGYRVNEKIRSLITFNHLNLLGEWPMKGKFDIIFCRNVVIYFSKDTQRVLFERYANILAPNGFLFIGHSESLHGVSSRFRAIGRTIYRKVS